MTRTRPDQKLKAQQLPMLRPLGKSEQLSAVSHALGFFKNVGMSAQYNLSNSTESPDLQRVVYAALADVVGKHAILSAIPVDEASPEAYFARLESIDLARCVFWRRRTGATAQGEADLELDTILEEQHNTDFKTNYGDLPFWRLIILQDAGSELSFTASFIFHHSLGDGATGSIFHSFFLQALNTAISLPSFVAQSSSIVTIDANIQLLSPLEQLHPLPINENLRDHRADGGKGLKEWFGNPIHTPLETHYKTLYFSPTTTAIFAKRCKHNGITVTSGLTAVLAGALLSALPEDIEALTGIIPINLRPWLNLPANSADGAMGSFIDAMKVQIRRSQYGQSGDDHVDRPHGLRAAHHTSREISSYLANTSPTGEPYTSIAPFKLIPDVAAVFSSLLGVELGALWSYAC
ncbi:hypothetical protein J4E85_011078 [Alternaria conjuncta]|uniref:uncharacterized protein n=1 Tax=Alternaria conjuncta TaxID=181017 RepID=UPI0022202340|nr:uncharacterized protein J4E85_011078 [Alternaria conjuncta]KAI4912345.1 hypothetical protein J4E85_011078 [Alternaria conjuncta]